MFVSNSFNFRRCKQTTSWEMADDFLGIATKRDFKGRQSAILFLTSWQVTQIRAQRWRSVYLQKDNGIDPLITKACLHVLIPIFS